MKKFIETKRLILRQWKESDRDTFAEINAAKENLPFFPRTYSTSESNQIVDKTIEYIEENGFGLFAVEIKQTGEFIGFTGLYQPTYKTPFTPCTEIGWRLHKNFWRKGYATEAAKGALGFAFNQLKFEEIVSFTASLNIPSIKVMERIGMTRDELGDFDHPNVPDGHILKRHVLYRLQLNQFRGDKT